MESTWFNLNLRISSNNHNIVCPPEPTWFNTEWPFSKIINKITNKVINKVITFGVGRPQSPSYPQNTCSNIIRNTKYNDWCLDEDDCPSPSPLSNHATLFPPPPPPSSFSTTENIARVAPPPTPKPKPKRRPQLLDSTSSLPNIPSSNLSFTTPLINSWTVPVTSCHSSFPQYTKIWIPQQII